MDGSCATCDMAGVCSIIAKKYGVSLRERMSVTMECRVIEMVSGISCLHKATCAHASGATHDSCVPVTRINNFRCMCSFFRFLAVKVVRRKIPADA